MNTQLISQPWCKTDEVSEPQRETTAQSIDADDPIALLEMDDPVFENTTSFGVTTEPTVRRPRRVSPRITKRRTRVRLTRDTATVGQKVIHDCEIVICSAYHEYTIDFTTMV